MYVENRGKSIKGLGQMQGRHTGGGVMGARRNFSRGGANLWGGGPKKSVKGGPHIF